MRQRTRQRHWRRPSSAPRRSRSSTRSVVTSTRNSTRYGQKQNVCDLLNAITFDERSCLVRSIIQKLLASAKRTGLKQAELDSLLQQVTRNQLLVCCWNSTFYRILGQERFRCRQCIDGCCRQRGNLIRPLFDNKTNNQQYHWGGGGGGGTVATKSQIRERRRL